MVHNFISFKRGITREVILFGNLAFKFPSVRTWYLFLEGFQCNMNEVSRRKCSAHFCPILFWIPGGFLVVMKRASSYELQEGEYDKFRALNELHCFVERKDCSFGLINDKLVAVDYGS